MQFENFRSKTTSFNNITRFIYIYIHISNIILYYSLCNLLYKDQFVFIIESKIWNSKISLYNSWITHLTKLISNMVVELCVENNATPEIILNEIEISL